MVAREHALSVTVRDGVHLPFVDAVATLTISSMVPKGVDDVDGTLSSSPARQSPADCRAPRSSIRFEPQVSRRAMRTSRSHSATTSTTDSRTGGSNETASKLASNSGNDRSRIPQRPQLSRVRPPHIRNSGRVGSTGFGSRSIDLIDRLPIVEKVAGRSVESPVVPSTRLIVMPVDRIPRKSTHQQRSNGTVPTTATSRRSCANRSATAYRIRACACSAVSQPSTARTGSEKNRFASSS